MTPAELSHELDYRKVERLALLCGDRVPTEQEMEMARGDVERFREAMNLVQQHKQKTK